MAKWTCWMLALAACGTGGTNPDDDDDDDANKRSLLVTIENIAPVYPLVQTGTFDTAIGAIAPGPIGPGQAYEVAFHAGRGQMLTFATMFGESNDFFYAPATFGISLYDEAGAPRSGDVTAELALFDAGTQLDQEPGLGPDQPARQAMPGAGERDLENTVHPAEDRYDNLPVITDVLRVTLTAGDAQRFKLRIENVSTPQTLVTSDGETHSVPLSPGVWVVHEGRDPLFSMGYQERGLGLEAIAEDGDPSKLAATIGPLAGVTAALSPGLWLVHADDDALFGRDATDRGWGLQDLAEDGDPARLATSLETRPDLGGFGTFDQGDDLAEPGPIRPQHAFSFVVHAAPGDRLSFATALTDANDAFFAPSPDGLALFGDDGEPRFGVLGDVLLWDAGTEVNQAPGVGNDQGRRQLGPDQGASEDVPIEPITARADGYVYPAGASTVRVTLTGLIR